MTTPAAMHAIALDLGGTDLKAACVSARGEVLEFVRLPSRAAEGEDALLDTLVGAARRWRLGAAALGMGCPGVIHPVSGVLVDVTPHLPLPEGFPLRETLARALALPVSVDNDANCAAAGEFGAGAAHRARVAVVITVGTGVGCGIVVDGRVLRGAWGGGGEIAHMGQGSRGPACGCGVTGCAEPVSGGEGLVHRARAAGLAAEGAADVFAAAADGDAVAARLVSEMIDALGQQVACAVQTVNPEVVVVGGGVAQAGEALLGPLREAVARYAQPSHLRGLRIVPAALGNRAGVVGAGLLGWAGAKRSAADRDEGFRAWDLE
jgi:glucokinase